MKLKFMPVVFAAVSLWGVPARADSFRVARVSDVKGTLSVRGADEEEASAVYANAVLREKDTLWTDQDTQAELELEHSSWLRLSEDTKLEVADLDATPEFRLWNGSVYLDVADHDNHPWMLRTPAGDVEVSPESVVRVDLGSGNDARVSVWSGEARILPGGGDAIRLHSSERAYLNDGRISESAARFDRDDRDGFDRYQRERADYYLDRPVPKDLEQPVLGSRELQEYGSWVVVDSVRYWRPRCEPDWRPYSRGYWSIVPGWGYTWIYYQPWGFATCHYGRWRWLPIHGWLWFPGYAWRPAWVQWSQFDDYIGWSPLDPWDRPCYYGSGLFVSLGFVVDDRSWTFCRRDRFHFGRHHPNVNGHERPPFYQGHEVRLDPGRFHPVRDADREIGIPKDHVRGATVGKDGRPIRERVLDLEKRLPQKRLPAIQDRYRIPPDQDRKRAEQPGNAERNQRPPFTRVNPGQILKGDDADRTIRRLPTPPIQPTPARLPDQPFRRKGVTIPTPPKPAVPAPARPRMTRPVIPQTPISRPNIRPGWGTGTRTQPGRVPTQPGAGRTSPGRGKR
jgi:hypothetical protein